jgi:replication factor C subunit 1
MFKKKFLQTKAAFTRAYNKEVHMTPYATGNVAKKGRGRGGGAATDNPGLEEEESLVVESEEEEEDISVDTMIKVTAKTDQRYN